MSKGKRPRLYVTMRHLHIMEMGFSRPFELSWSRFPGERIGRVALGWLKFGWIMRHHWLAKHWEIRRGPWET